jgi:hypothetical protein
MSKMHRAIRNRTVPDCRHEGTFVVRAKKGARVLYRKLESSICSSIHFKHAASLAFEPRLLAVLSARHCTMQREALDISSNSA